MNLKNLRTFKGNKRGAPWILKPVDEHNKSFADIPKLKPEEVNIIALIRPEVWVIKIQAKRTMPRKFHFARFLICRMTKIT